MTAFSRVSLRDRILLLVFAGVVLPLGLVGLWLNRSSERSGVALVRARLNESLEETVLAIGSRWSRTQSRLLDLAEAPEIRSVLRHEMPGALADNESARSAILPLWEAVAGMAWVVEVRDLEGRAVARLPDDLGQPRSRSSPPPGFLNYEIVARERFSGEPLGTLAVQFRSDGLIAPTLTTGVSGSVLAILDRRNGSNLTPLPVEPAALRRIATRKGAANWCGSRYGTATSGR